jgi:hypothetical protein
MIILFEKSCIYNNNETILYGQFLKKFKSVEIKEECKYEIVICNGRNDFYIKIIGKIEFISDIIFNFEDNQTYNISNICLLFPFDNCNLKLDVNKSSIITTICKNYSHRLEEWIQYNLFIGFSGIVIFNNEGNTNNEFTECLEDYDMNKSIIDICNKYKDKVFVVDFPYSAFEGQHWNNIQRISLHIGVNAFKKKCKFISLIDADEFIYFTPCRIKDARSVQLSSLNCAIGEGVLNEERCNRSFNNIESFLEKYSCGITMQSNILTNKNDDDIINNNVLQLALYVGENKYLKTILYTKLITEYEFIVTPHNHPTARVFDKSEIMHFHCWMNKRYKYNENMPKINIFSNLFG